MFWRKRQRWLQCCRRLLSPSICGEFADGAIQEEASFPWLFGIRLIRYRRGPSPVKNERAVRTSKTTNEIQQKIQMNCHKS